MGLGVPTLAPPGIAGQAVAVAASARGGGLPVLVHTLATWTGPVTLLLAALAREPVTVGVWCCVTRAATAEECREHELALPRGTLVCERRGTMRGAATGRVIAETFAAVVTGKLPPDTAAALAAGLPLGLALGEDAYRHPLAAAPALSGVACRAVMFRRDARVAVAAEQLDPRFCAAIAGGELA
jgi:hypothetical protein